jgi:hypothetical protein
VEVVTHKPTEDHQQREAQCGQSNACAKNMALGISMAVDGRAWLTLCHWCRRPYCSGATRARPSVVVVGCVLRSARELGLHVMAWNAKRDAAARARVPISQMNTVEGCGGSYAPLVAPAPAHTCCLGCFASTRRQELRTVCIDDGHNARQPFAQVSAAEGASAKTAAKQRSSACSSRVRCSMLCC